LQRVRPPATTGTGKGERLAGTAPKKPSGGAGLQNFILISDAGGDILLAMKINNDHMYHGAALTQIRCLVRVRRVRAFFFLSYAKRKE
jgi:hypothetical protein